MREIEMRKTLNVVLSMGLVVSLSACANKESNEPGIRTTAYGKVQGILVENDETYYGIPYGANPTGELRWQEPEEPESWNETRDCTEKEEVSMQMANVTADDGSTSREVVGTTDCLNLDVFTKTDADDLPVLVFIHGGNNQTGSSYDTGIGLELVENTDSVLVSINYRTGLLGFNSLPAVQDDETETGNYALQDMALALEWVQDNIENFGGDPDNVTVSGFSAGGRNVMAMLVSPMFEDLFDKAIAFSGGMTISELDDSIAKDAQIIAPLAVEDGKAATAEEAASWLMNDSEEVKEYLYGIDESRLTQLMSDAGIRMAKFPHLFGDNVVLPATGFEGDNYVNDVPVMMLTGSTEFSFFTAFDPFYATIADEQESVAAKDFAIKYGSDFYRTFNTQLSAMTMAENYDSDIYLCQINYGDAMSPAAIPVFGSFHGIFVPMLTSQSGYASIADFTTPGFVSIAEEFNAYLKNFLHEGNPNSDEIQTEWQTWDSTAKQTLVFDVQEDSEMAAIESQDVYKSNQEIIDEMASDTTVSDELKQQVIANILNGRWFSGDLDSYFNTPSLW